MALYNKKEIYMFRHGQTDWNLADKFQGWTDIPLNNTGIQQAQALSAQLADVKFDVMYTSPLRRAIQTAEIVLNGQRVPMITAEGLKERNFGDYEGKFMKWTNDPAAVSLDPSRDSIVMMNFEQLDKYVPNGETRVDVVNRVWHTLVQIALNPKYKTIGVAGHYGTLSAVIQTILGAQNIRAIEMPNCAYIKLQADGSKLSLPQIPEWVIMVGPVKNCR